LKTNVQWQLAFGSLNGHARVDFMPRGGIDVERFGSAGNNLILPRILFAPVEARFFRLICLQGTDGRASDAENSLIPTDGKNP
jgi:hypothetical protein